MVFSQFKIPANLAQLAVPKMHCLYVNAVVQPSVQHCPCYMAWKTKVHTWCRHCHLCINAPMWREKRWLQGIIDPPSYNRLKRDILPKNATHPLCAKKNVLEFVKADCVNVSKIQILIMINCLKCHDLDTTRTIRKMKLDFSLLSFGSSICQLVNSSCPFGALVNTTVFK